ncbi:MAG: hypothetical protein AAF628_03895 [Planctomycetota bacterium]
MEAEHTDDGAMLWLTPRVTELVLRMAEDERQAAPDVWSFVNHDLQSRARLALGPVRPGARQETNGRAKDAGHLVSGHLVTLSLS